MLCYLRFPGRRIARRRATAPLLVFVADQIEALPDCIDEYLATERNPQRHAIECQEQLGLRPFGRLAAAEVTEALLAQAIENDRLSFLAGAVMQACRARDIVVPSPAALEPLCADLRHGARREAHRRLTGRLLREANRSGAGRPKSAPTGFVRQRWAPYVLPGGIIDRRHDELCILSELRDRLRVGGVWVSGSRQYRSFEDRLISAGTLREQAGTLPIAVEHDFDQFVAGRQALLDERLKAVDAQAAAGRLPDVTVTNGVLKIAPIEKARRRRRLRPNAGGTPLCHAATHPHHRPAGRSGGLDWLPGLLHPFAHCQDRGPQPHPDGRVACRRAQPRPLRAWPRRAASPASASSPGNRTGTSAKRPTSWRCAAWSTNSGASLSRRISAAAPPRHRTASSSRPPASAGMQRG